MSNRNYTHKNVDTTNSEGEKREKSNSNIEALYQARKEKVKAPKINFDNAGFTKSPSRLNVIYEVFDALTMHFKTTAIFASLALALLVISYQQYIAKGIGISDMNSMNAHRQYVNVQMHTLETESLATENMRVFNYNKANRALLAQKSEQNKHLQVVRVLNYEGSLQLVNCNDELIEISQRALALLYSPEIESIQAARPAFKPDELMALTFDQDGYILAIKRSAQSNQCS